MAINKPVKKGTKQRFSQTENITVGTGDYGNKKSFNLTKKQLGAKGSKAAASDKIAISRTRYDSTTKKVYGPKGQPITGRVDMGGGNIAVYKQGVRVTARKPAAKPKGGGGNGGNGGKDDAITKTDISTKRGGVSRGPLMQADRNPRPKPRGDSGTNRGPLLQGERKPAPTRLQKTMAGNSGFVRGNKGSSSVASNMAKGMTRAEALRAKRVEDTKNQNRNAAAVAALTLGPALAPLLGTPAAGAVGGAVVRGVAGTAGRTAVGRGVANIGRGMARDASKSLGGRSATGASTSNKASIAAFKAGQKIKTTAPYRAGQRVLGYKPTKPLTAAQKKAKAAAAAKRKANKAKGKP